MRYLIDGYNLMHAIGALQGRAGPHALEKGRLHLLGWLKGVLGTEAHRATVVFDARQPPPGAKARLEHDGIQVLFAVQQQQADDLIEEIVQREATPRQLTVVSDDHRLQRSATRRGCPWLGCLDFHEQLELGEPGRQLPAPPVEPDRDKVSDPEHEHWLKEFADLEGDHEWKDFLDFDLDDPDAEPPRR